MQPLERRAHVVDVRERLAHAHEHDVRDALRSWRAARARPARRSRRSRGGARSRPDRSRRTCTPSRSRPATRRTPSRARRCSISTVSTCAPSCVRQSHLRRRAVGAGLLGDRRERERERVGELGAERLRERGELLERAPLRPEPVVELRERGTRGAPRASRSAAELVARARRSGWSRGLDVDARTRGRCGAPRSRATGTARARRCCRPRRTACPSTAPRACTACEPGERERPAEPGALGARDRRRSRRSRRAAGSGASGRVQLQPVEAGQPFGVEREEEQRPDRTTARPSGARSVASCQPPCSGWLGERPVVHREPSASSRPGSKLAHVDAGRPGGATAATGSGARISYSVRARPEARPRRTSASSASVAPKTQHASSPPPCAATCATRGVEQGVGDRGVARLGEPDDARRSSVEPSVAVDARDVQVRARRRRGSRPNRRRGARGRATRRRRARRGRRRRARPRRARRSRSRCVANSEGSTRVSASVVTARGYPSPVARPRGAKARAGAVVELLAELYPDARCALDARERVRAARRDDPVGAVHRRAREHGDARAVRPVSDAGRSRRAPIPRSSRSWSARPASSARRRRTSSGWRRRWRRGSAARSRPSSTTS